MADARGGCGRRLLTEFRLAVSDEALELGLERLERARSRRFPSAATLVLGSMACEQSSSRSPW